MPILPLRAVGVVLSLSIGGGSVDVVLSVEPVHDPPSTFDEASEFEGVSASGYGRVGMWVSELETKGCDTFGATEATFKKGRTSTVA